MAKSFFDVEAPITKAKAAATVARMALESPGDVTRGEANALLHMLFDIEEQVREAETTWHEILDADKRNLRKVA